jgi:hypothetical protein
MSSLSRRFFLNWRTASGHASVDGRKTVDLPQPMADYGGTLLARKSIAHPLRVSCRNKDSVGQLYWCSCILKTG